MDPAPGDAKVIPRKRQIHHSHDESVDEAAALIEKEPVEIEAEAPAEENEPVEGSDQEDKFSPAFEEE